MTVHYHTVRVYWEDTDAGGIVYHANYLKFAERARSEFVRGLGVVQSKLAAEGADGGFVFAVRRMEIAFLRAARLDDVLEVQTRLLSVEGARLALSQRICFPGDPQELAQMKVGLACMRLSGRPTRIPQDLKEKFLQFVCSADSGETACYSGNHSGT